MTTRSENMKKVQEERANLWRKYKLLVPNKFDRRVQYHYDTATDIRNEIIRIKNMQKNMKVNIPSMKKINLEKLEARLDIQRVGEYTSEYKKIEKTYQEEKYNNFKKKPVMSAKEQAHLLILSLDNDQLDILPDETLNGAIEAIRNYDGEIDFNEPDYDPEIFITAFDVDDDNDFWNKLRQTTTVEEAYDIFTAKFGNTQFKYINNLTLNNNDGNIWVFVNMHLNPHTPVFDTYVDIVDMLYLKYGFKLSAAIMKTFEIMYSDLYQDMYAIRVTYNNADLRNGDNIIDEYELDELEEEIPINDNNIKIDNVEISMDENCIFAPLRRIIPELPKIPPVPITTNEAREKLRELGLGDKIKLRFTFPFDYVLRNNRHMETSKRNLKVFEYIVNNNHAVLVFNKKYFTMTQNYKKVSELVNIEHYQHNIIQLYHRNAIRTYLIDDDKKLSEIVMDNFGDNTYDKFQKFASKNDLTKCHADFKNEFVDSCVHINRWTQDENKMDADGVYEVDKSGSYMTKTKYTQRIPNAGFTYTRGFHVDNVNAAVIIYPDTKIPKSWSMPFEFTNKVPVPVVLALREYGYQVYAENCITMLCYSWSDYDLEAMYKTGEVEKRDARIFTGMFITGGIRGEYVNAGSYDTKCKYERNALYRAITNMTLESTAFIKRNINLENPEDPFFNYRISKFAPRRNYVQHYSWCLANNAVHMIQQIHANNMRPYGGNRDALFYKEKPKNILSGFTCKRVNKTYPLISNYGNVCNFSAPPVDKFITDEPLNLRRINIVNYPGGTGKTKGLSDLFKTNPGCDVIYTAPKNILVDAQAKYDNPYDRHTTAYKAFNLMKKNKESADRQLPNIAIIDEAMQYSKAHLTSIIKSGVPLIMLYDPNQTEAILAGYKHIYSQVIKPLCQQRDIQKLRVCDPDDNLRYLDDDTKQFFKTFIANKGSLLLNRKLVKSKIETISPNNEEMRQIMYDAINGNAEITNTYHRESIKMYGILNPDTDIKAKSGKTIKMRDAVIRKSMNDIINEEVEPGLFITVYSSQGLTFETPQYIVDSALNNSKILYTALSRNRRLSNIKILSLKNIDPEYELNVHGENPEPAKKEEPVYSEKDFNTFKYGDKKGILPAVNDTELV